MKAFFKAHAESARRGNLSSVAVANTAVGSGSYCNAIAASILTLGGTHAPIEAVIDLLNSENPVEHAKLVLDARCKVPGWGNSFVKGNPDPIWKEVDEEFKILSPNIHRKIGSVTEYLHSVGKHIFPNPACYTAAFAILKNIDKRVAAEIFIAARLSVWTHIFLATLDSQQERNN